MSWRVLLCTIHHFQVITIIFRTISGSLQTLHVSCSAVPRLQVALGQTKFSKDGKLMAYTLSSGGSDWVNIKVLTIDQETGDTTDLDDKLEYVKFSSLAWTHDHQVGCHYH